MCMYVYIYRYRYLYTHIDMICDIYKIYDIYMCIVFFVPHI